MVQQKHEFYHLDMLSLWKNPQGKGGRDNQVDNHGRSDTQSWKHPSKHSSLATGLYLHALSQVQ